VIRRLGALACIGFSFWLAGCGGGGGDDLLGEGDVRDCLVQAGFGLQPGSGGVEYAPAYLTTAPDFTAHTKNGASVDVIVLGSEERARRVAAHARSALATLGSPGASAETSVIASQNAVAVFHRPPSQADRDAVRGCFK
jgi:hypothetical protein